MTKSSKRPENLAWASLVLSVLVFGAAFLVGRWSGFFAVSALAWLSLSVALIWFVLAVQFHLRTLAEQEKLDMSQLTRDKGASTIFQATGERASVFAVAQRRVLLVEKWFIPILSGLIAAYQIIMGLYLLRVALAGAEAQTRQPLVCAMFMVAVAFVSFLISRYSTGMAAEVLWRPLRAGGSALLAVALVSFALAIGFAFAQWQVLHVVNVAAYVVPILLLVLGCETALNVVLDIYRPRLKGQYSRAAFDSRLLGTINEPGGIFRSAAGAIDYQFGFKVSQTWFYKLLEKAIVPLVVFGALSLYLLSCVVVVGPNEEAVVEHFGNPIDAAGDVRLVGPGLTLKWPWPIDIAYKYPSRRIMEMPIGFVPKTDPKTGEIIQEREFLWGRAHYKDEYEILVASKYADQDLGEDVVPVNLVNANIPVQYRVKDLYSFLYKHRDGRKRLEDICYNELAKFAASATVEVDTEADLETSLLGAGRSRAKQVLTEKIQQAADRAELGVEIVFVGMQGIHPPAEVAPDYQRVIGAIQEKQALIFGAQAERNRQLGALVGSAEAAEGLADLAARYQQAEAEKRPDDVNKLGSELDRAFSAARGEVFKRLQEASSYKYERVTLASADGERFAAQLEAYRAAPEVYKRDLRLKAIEEVFASTRKFIIVADPNNRHVFIVNLEDKVTPGLFDVADVKETSEK